MPDSPWRVLRADGSLSDMATYPRARDTRATFGASDLIGRVRCPQRAGSQPVESPSFLRHDDVPLLS
jgi:hypothetical protein